MLEMFYRMLYIKVYGYALFKDVHFDVTYVSDLLMWKYA